MRESLGVLKAQRRNESEVRLAAIDARSVTVAAGGASWRRHDCLQLGRAQSVQVGTRKMVNYA